MNRCARVPAIFGPRLLLSLLSLLPVLGCRGHPPPGEPSLVLDVAISPTPPGVGPARLIVTLRDTLGAPVEGAGIRVEGNMSHAGMVPVVDSARAQGPGLYVVPAFRFSMAGDWVLTVAATLPDGRRTLVTRNTRVVGAPPGGAS